MRVALLLLSIFSLALSQDLSGTVYWTNSTGYSLKLNVVDVSGAAWGTFEDTLNQTGWGVLNIRTGRGFPDNVQMYAAGLLEGTITAPRIPQAYTNMLSARGNPTSQQLYDWLSTNEQYGREQAVANPTDSFWRSIGLLYAQFDGLVKGYTDTASQNSELTPLSAMDLLVMQALVDVNSLNQAIFPQARPVWSNMSYEDFLEYGEATDHCSCLTKLTPDYSELYLAHDTWTTYQDMNRIYKHYYFDLADLSVVARGHSSSSYPGFLYSFDDYYITSQQLVVTETTNGMYNNAQYDAINTKMLMTWLRSRAANMLSTNGRDWTNFAQRHHSGTYPNQWIVLDYKLFTPGQPLLPGTLWIMEEIPSMTHAADVTTYLAKGDWRSYNIAFFPDIYVASGVPERVAQYGVIATYDLAPRAKIFRRDVNNVKDLNSLKYIMRYNDFANDPFSQNDPHYSVASRQDLTPASVGSPTPKGATDTKITNSQMISSMSVLAIAGPTTQNQPIFSWTGTWDQYSHLGHPTHFNFDWVTMKPTLF